MARGRPFTGKNDPRNGKGGKRPGAGRKPDAVRAIRLKIAEEDGEAARQRLRKLVNSKDNYIALQASKALLDHAIGRARQAVDLVIEESDDSEERALVRLLVEAGREDEVPESLVGLIEEVKNTPGG